MTRATAAQGDLRLGSPLDLSGFVGKADLSQTFEIVADDPWWKSGVSKNREFRNNQSTPYRFVAGTSFEGTKVPPSATSARQTSAAALRDVRLNSVPAPQITDSSWVTTVEFEPLNRRGSCWKAPPAPELTGEVHPDDGRMPRSLASAIPEARRLKPALKYDGALAEIAKVRKLKRGRRWQPAMVVYTFAKPRL
jgi:hypothetical protein